MKTLVIIFFTALTLLSAPNVGDAEKSFTLPHLYEAGKSSSNTDFHGKVTLVNIWASWCTGCQEEMPLFVALQTKFPKNLFEIVLINVDKDPQNGIDFLHRVDSDKKLTALYDATKSLAKAYRCAGMPSSYLIDKNGKIIDIFVGSLDATAMKNLEQRLHTLLGK